MTLFRRIIPHKLPHKPLIPHPPFTQTQKFTYKTKPSYSPPSNPPTLTPQRLYQKDWLSQTEVTKIFSTADPNSVLSLLSHLSTRKDYKPNEALFTTIITKLGEARNFDGIDGILMMIKTQKSCRLSDGFFYNVLRVYGNVGGLVDKVVEILFEMPRCYKCYPSVKTFNYVMNSLVNARKFDVIRRVFLGASELWVEIDACTLNIVIKGLCIQGRLEDALKVFDEFPKYKFKKSKMTYSTIMNCMCEKGMVDEAMGMVERMEEEGVEVDSVVFNVLVSGLRKERRVEEAMELLDRMKRKGCEPNKGTYQEVLYGLLMEERFVDAKKFVLTMRSKALIPSLESYKLLLRGLCAEGLVEDVDWVLKSMVLVGFRPRMDIWRRAVKLVFSGKESSTRLFCELVEQEIAQLEHVQQLLQCPSSTD